MTIAVCLTLAVIISTILLTIVISLLLLYIGKNLHNKMIRSVSKARTQFFDCNPSGRILNRFSKDTAVLDVQLTLLFYFTIGFGLQVMISLALTIYVIPLMGAVLVLLFVLMICFKRQINVITRETFKWDGITRSPMNSLFTATIKGLMTIRAY